MTPWGLKLKLGYRQLQIRFLMWRLRRLRSRPWGFLNWRLLAGTKRPPATTGQRLTNWWLATLQDMTLRAWIRAKRYPGPDGQLRTAMCASAMYTQHLVRLAEPTMPFPVPVVVLAQLQHGQAGYVVQGTSGITEAQIAWILKMALWNYEVIQGRAIETKENN